MTVLIKEDGFKFHKILDKKSRDNVLYKVDSSNIESFKLTQECEKFNDQNIENKLLDAQLA